MMLPSTATAAACSPSCSSNGRFNLEDETENIRSMIEMYVWDILCSRKWTESMLLEVAHMH